MNKFIIFSLLLFTAFTGAFAQQDAQYTQYMFNSMVINPAYAGSLDATSITAIYRHQWVGMAGAPRTFAASVHSPIVDKMGLGFFLENDVIGVHNRLSAYGSYAYHLPVGESTKLSLGLSAGMLYYTSDWSKAPDILNPDDPQFTGTSSKVLPNFGVGAFFYDDNYYAGISVPHLLAAKMEAADTSISISKYDQHIFLTGGYVFELSPSLKMKPAVLLKMVPGKAPVEADINLNFLIKDAIGLGAGFHTGTGIAFLAQYFFNNGLRLGYAYDYNLNQLSGFNSGSHEIMLGWDIARKKSDRTPEEKEKVLSPRFF